MNSKPLISRTFTPVKYEDNTAPELPLAYDRNGWRVGYSYLSVSGSLILRPIFLCLLSLIIVACGASQNQANIDEPFIGPAPPVNPNISSEKITLEVWLDLDFVKDDTLFLETAEDFEKAYPQITVDIQSFVGQSIPSKVSQAVLTGTPPDVVQGHVYAMAGRGLAEPLNRQWQEWGPEAKDQFLPAALEEVTWQDTLYGVPLDIYTLVLLYNKSHFDEANLPYPEGDFDLFSFRNATAALSKPDGERYGLGFTADPRYVYAWLAGAGGDVLVGSPEAGFTLTLNSETNIDALRFLIGMVEAGYGQRPITRPRDYEDAREQFLSGQISMYVGGPWDIHLIQSAYQNFPLGVARLPKTPAADSAASVLGSTGLFVPRGARHRDAAFEFIKWMTSDRYAIPMARRLGRYPAKTWLQTSPYFADNLLLVPFFDQLNAARPYHLDLFPKAEEAFVDAIKASFYGVDPAEALNEAQEKGQLFVRERSS